MKNLTRILALLLILCTVFSLCACGGGKDNEDTTDKVTTKADKETEKDTTAEDTTAEDTTEAETTDAETTEAETTGEDTTAVTTTPVQTQKPPVQTQQQTQAVTNPSGEEILGQGSKDNPYLEIPTVGTGSMSVKTVTIPQGKSLYYSIQRIGGMYVTINSASAYVVCNGTRYNAQNGVVAFVAPNALASDFITLEIGNTGAAASFTLVFTSLTGSQANPMKLSAMGSSVNLSLYAGDEDGYFYKYNAQQTGKLRFYVTANSADYIFVVTNNRNSAQRTSEGDLLSDAQGKYIELEVNAGDELIINIGAKPDRRNNRPALNLTWVGKFI